MMGNVSVLSNTYFMNDFSEEVRLNFEKISFGRTNFSPVINSMIAEGGISFFSYLNRLGLSREPNLMVLSSRHHYYYDESELKSVKTLVNIKKLNLIKHPDEFLNTLNRILPQEANFIGCFSDSKNLKGYGNPFYQPSRLLNRFINILDARTDRNLDRDEVIEMLAVHGFKIIDMTEIEGVTYFYAKPAQKPAELRA